MCSRRYSSSGRSLDYYSKKEKLFFTAIKGTKKGDPFTHSTVYVESGKASEDDISGFIKSLASIFLPNCK